MAMLTQPAFGPKLSIGLILAGTLMDVWTLVWRFTLGGDELTPTSRFFFYGTLLTGITLLLVGLFLGHIGRAARKAEMPPAEITTAEAAINQTAAAHPPAVVSNMGGVAPGVAGQVAVPTNTNPRQVVAAPSPVVAGVR
ncbi:hypothetical protein [Limnoglobus roseus]|uniref:Uncharacterized protein n=1 Tax=Limnoglobus roseus TaxID=2598579 RepID=A0A5C1AAP0_9BACT|nr:hypothetical protein [Limnoglobus roseus]QEL15287.1 hypothetical protein PX52LOC_02202 [Limnoglobus roseus]